MSRRHGKGRRGVRKRKDGSIMHAIQIHMERSSAAALRLAIDSGAMKEDHAQHFRRKLDQAEGAAVDGVATYHLTVSQSRRLCDALVMCGVPQAARLRDRIAGMYRERQHRLGKTVAQWAKESP